MRWLLVSFFLGSLGLFGGEPSEVALKFLKKVKEADRTSKLSNDLAISVFCGPEKREIIDARWQTRSSWLRETDFKIASLLEKVDGELAAVLVGARSKASPESAIVMALGLVKKGSDWKVAPIEGSFDNTGLGFGSELKNRVRALEQWMILEKINGTARLREDERKRFRKSMEGLVTAEKLKLEDPEDVILEFLKAAHAGEIEKLLVWQGVLEREQLPERDWARDIRATRKGMNSEDSRSAWRTLRSNKVMKVVVEGHGDTEDANYLVSFLSTFNTDPRNNSLNPVRFKMLMTDGGWRIKLPSFFAYDNDDVSVHSEAFDEEFEWEDRKSAAEMGSVFEIENDPIRTDEPEEMLEGIITDLKSGALHSFLQRHFRELENFEDDEEGEVLPNQNPGKGNIGQRRMERYREALNWWGGSLGDEETAKATIRTIYREGNLSLGIIEVGIDESGWKPRYMEVWLAKEDDGWMILPGSPEPLSHSIDPSLVETRQKISKSYAADLVKFKKEYLAGILKSIGFDDPSGNVIDEARGLKVVKDWGETAAKGSMMDLVVKSAIRVMPDEPEKFMRDLGYLRSAAAASVAPDRILGTMTSGRFRGFSLMVDAGAGIEPSYPLAIVVPTKGGGHRLLTDIELPLETNKGLRILNDARIKSLTAKLPKKDLVSIVELRAWHQKTARKTWEKWNLDQASKAE